MSRTSPGGGAARCIPREHNGGAYLEAPSERKVQR